MEEEKEAKTNKYVRKYRRSSRLYAWLFAVSAALLVAQTMERAADKEGFDESLSVREAALYSVTYALKVESERSARLEVLLDQAGCSHSVKD